MVPGSFCTSSQSDLLLGHGFRCKLHSDLSDSLLQPLGSNNLLMASWQSKAHLKLTMPLLELRVLSPGQEPPGGHPLTPATLRVRGCDALPALHLHEDSAGKSPGLHLTSLWRPSSPGPFSYTHQPPSAAWGDSSTSSQCLNQNLPAQSLSLAPRGFQCDKGQALLWPPLSASRLTCPLSSPGISSWNAAAHSSHLLVILI